MTIIRHPHESIGYYDLEDRETRLRQSRQAKQAGISAFAYYHYWTQDRPIMDKALLKMLEDPVEETLHHFLIWANISWTKKWDGASEILLPQTYGEQSSWETHFQFLLKFFSHPKQYLHRNKIVFGLYHPSDMTWDLFDKMIKYFRKRTRETLNKDMHVIIYDNTFLWNEGFANHPETDAALCFEPMRSRARGWLDKFQREYLDRRPDMAGQRTVAYDYWDSCTAATIYAKRRDSNKDTYLTIVAGWDNTPRYEAQNRTSAYQASVWAGFTPDLFLIHAKHVLRLSHDYASSPIVFVNAWNEWNEQAVLEPCTKFGTGTRM